MVLNSRRKSDAEELRWAADSVGSDESCADEERTAFRATSWKVDAVR